jgi:predicted esterase
VFHGTGLSGAAAFSIYGLQRWVDAGFAIVAPDSNGNGAIWPVWDALAPPGAPPAPNADLALFDDLLQCVAAHHPIDANRVYVAGHSAGGAMTHAVLARRSAVLAGGIPASGAFDLTQPTPPGGTEPLTVIVTWGGSNDVYSGTAGGASIENLGYVEQSALASQAWEARPGSHQIACRGDEVGHAWLAPLNGWMIDVLLAHPRGAATRAGWTLPPLPAGARASCSEDAATYTPPVTVTCAASAVDGCRAYCQLLGDCLVENGTLGLPAAAPLLALGFGGGDVCGGCLAGCEQDAVGSAPDQAFLACVSSAVPSTACGPGFAGTAAFGTVGACCGDAPGSAVCARFCTAFGQAALFAGMLSGCP